MPGLRPFPPPDVSVNGRDLASWKWGRRKVLTLPLEKLRPAIRIAHQMRGALEIPRRIILDHELVFIRQGQGVIRFESESVSFKAGDLLFIPPFAPHVFESPAHQDGEHLAIHFDFAAHFPPSSTNLLGREPYEVHFARGFSIPRHVAARPVGPVSSWMEQIVSLFSQGDDLNRLRAETLLLNVVTHLFEVKRAASDTSIPQELSHALRVRIDRALLYMEGHLAERISPADLAREAGLSVSHFTKLFRRWSTLAPGEYVLRRRVAEARRQLGDANLSIKEVATRCGFDDPYYFSKVFRRIDGLPPSRFREALLAVKPRK